MSQSTRNHLDRLAGNTSGIVLEDNNPLNYQTRPANVQTLGYQSPPPNVQYSLVSPLTEVSRVEESFVVPAGGTVYVPTQITMTDANGTTIVFNYDMPTIG